MKKIIALLLILSPCLLKAQDQGIHFEASLSWATIQAKAKAENKYIFVDCYATWCGPCKWMVANIFPQREVGNYFNAHFINISLQMDRTKNDNASVKAWYVDAERVGKDYEIDQYPTYLFFSPDGKITHRFSGAISDKMEFIKRAEEAIDPSKQYYSIMDAFKVHKGDSAYLYKALSMAMKQDDEKNIESIGNEYLNSIKNYLQKDNILTIAGLIGSIGEKCKKGYQEMIAHAPEIDKTMGDSLYVESLVANIICNKEIKSLNGKPAYWGNIKENIFKNYPTLSPGIIPLEEELFNFKIRQQLRVYFTTTKTLITLKDWETVLNRKNKQYPDRIYKVGRAVAEAKVNYYSYKKMWPECSRAAYSYLHQCGKELNEGQINNVAWYQIFQHSNDTKILEEAIIWMKHVIEIKPNEAYLLDTYANLLYKSGDKEKAIAIDTRAIELGRQAISLENRPGNKALLLRDQKEYEASLEKMKEGLPTWTDNAVTVKNN